MVGLKRVAVAFGALWMAGGHLAVADAPPCPPPRWEYRAQPGWHIAPESAGVADQDGNHYFLECQDPAGSQNRNCDLVSLSPDGHPRFRTSKVLQQSPFEPGSFTGPVAMGDLVLLVTSNRSDLPGDFPLLLQLSAYRASNGAVAWTRDVRQDLLGIDEVPKVRLQAGRPVRGEGYASLNVTYDTQETNQRQSFLLGYDLAGGALRQTVTAPPASPLADEQGDLQVLGSGQLASWTPAAGLRYRVHEDAVHLQLEAVGENLLVETRQGVPGTPDVVQLRQGQDGSLLDSTAATAGHVRLSGGLLELVGCLSPSPCQQVSLFGYDTRTRTLRWERPLGSAALQVQGPIITRSGAALLFTQPVSPPGGPPPVATLREIDPDGREVSACQLPEAIADVEPALAGGQLLVLTGGAAPVLRGLDAGGRSEGTGWVAAHGSGQRDNRARR